MARNLDPLIQKAKEKAIAIAGRYGTKDQKQFLDIREILEYAIQFRVSECLNDEEKKKKEAAAQAAAAKKRAEEAEAKMAAGAAKK